MRALMFLTHSKALQVFGDGDAILHGWQAVEILDRRVIAIRN